VKLYLATEQGGIGFNMLHKTCLNRIQMKVWCPHHEEVVSRSETVRGYEWTKDKYVVVTDEDLESVPLKTVRAIEIEKCVDEQLVESMAGTFDATEYHDEYREALMGVIEAKVAGEKPKRAVKEEPTKIGDLMAALEASVAAAREGRRTGGEAKAAGSTASGGR